MESIKEIALAFPRGAHQELFIEGVLRYAREQDRNWSYITAPESLSFSVLDLVGWPGDGILAAINTEKEAACAHEMKLPIVNMSSALAVPGIPRITLDNMAIGRLAADHLVSKGFRHFAFYGLERVEYSRLRKQGFAERLAESECSTVEFLAEPTFGTQGAAWLKQYQALAGWLKQLTTPCGLFAVSDYRARQVLDACRQAELKVPEAVAVIGVDNEQVICEHAHPSLTSVARNDQMEGYRAAALLDQMMRGETAPASDEVIPPMQVVERESTTTFAVTDSRLRSALDYLHTHLGEPVTIDELTDHAGVSRRWLEYAFRDALGETPYQYLRRQRLERAKRMLVKERNDKIYQIAHRTGFSSAKQLTTAFQQEYGMSPREYRRTTQK
ncbi:Xylose operon regulatory protein [Pseudobythopirellula maris]|uniref:Xylose operon regulatory protein n=1 Tax=Pseudobythopirellula maris TaxID=2527991 RepID=A0A5C5ZJ66_9BACT|nr:xylose operon transcription regulator XylR [Pseudobythopirellula maris]TWT87165.1 Xylose operon regulatory protein [Pseudobythopirellula maris]